MTDDKSDISQLFEDGGRDRYKCPITGETEDLILLRQSILKSDRHSPYTLVSGQCFHVSVTLEQVREWEESHE